MSPIDPPEGFTFENIYESVEGADEGIHVNTCTDAAGRVVKVALIDETNGELVEMDPEVALAAAEALVAKLRGAAFGPPRRLH